MKSNMKKVMAIYVFMMLFLTSVCSVNEKAYAAASTATTVLNGSISPTVLDVSVPATMVFTVNPNDKDNTYVSSKAKIINNTNAPIKVSINSGVDNFKQSSGSTWHPEDYLPSDLNWDSLGKEKSESSLALGVKMSDESQWRKVSMKNTLWVKEHDTEISAVVFGELNALSSADISLDVYHGNAFSEQKSCSYDVVWSFTLAD